MEFLLQASLFRRFVHTFSFRTASEMSIIYCGSLKNKKKGINHDDDNCF